VEPSFLKVALRKSMTEAGSIWEGKPSRLQDHNQEKIEPLVGPMGELRESIVYMRNTTWSMSCAGLDVVYDVFIARHAHPCVR
jgi:hypothetical protein